MAKKTPIINDFRSGELTPGLDARADIKEYYRGCRVLLNAMPLVEGGVERVPGTYYVRPTKLIEEGWTLRVTKSGTGTGVVTSDVPGIDCGSSCYTFFAGGTTVVLTATPDTGQSFIGWSGDGTGTVTRSVFMDGNKVVNAEFSLFQTKCMWGWFKFNEGSGIPIIDYSPIVTNGLIQHFDGTPATTVDLTYAWDHLAGFGSCRGSYGGTDGLIRFTRSTADRYTTYASLVGFIYPGLKEAYQTNSATAIQLGISGTANYIGVGWQSLSSPRYWCIGLPTGVKFSTTLAATYNIWYCVYAYSQQNTNNTGLYVRASGGDWQLARSGDASGNVGNQQATVRVFGAQNNPHTMSIGDVLYYACEVPSGIITLDQATVIYNQLKSRYGMS